MSTAVLTRSSPTVRSAARPRRRTRYLSTGILLLGALYCVLPVLWAVIAATRGPGDLFTTFSFWPSFNGGFGYNLSHLLDFRDGIFWKWALNSLLYAGAGTPGSRGSRTRR